MSGLFYTDLTLEVGLETISRHFALETFVPGLGLLVGSSPLAVASFFEPQISSASAFSELAERLALAVKGIAAETGNTITLTTYSTKYEGASGQLHVRPLIVLSTVPVLSEALKIGSDTLVMATIEAGEFTLKKILKAAGSQLKLIDSAAEIYRAGRMAVLPTTSGLESDTVLESCLGGLGLKPYLKCLLTDAWIGAIFARVSLPQIASKDLSEDVFGALVGESLTPGLGCRVDSYVAAPRLDGALLPTCYLDNVLESDGMIEGFSSYYIHWEKKDVIAEHLGSFMEHLAIRTFELNIVKSLAATGPSLWSPSFEHNGVALVNVFPGMIALLNSSLAERHNRFLVT